MDGEHFYCIRNCFKNLRKLNVPNNLLCNKKAERIPPANILPNAYIGKKADAVKKYGGVAIMQPLQIYIKEDTHI